MVTRHPRGEDILNDAAPPVRPLRRSRFPFVGVVAIVVVTLVPVAALFGVGWVAGHGQRLVDQLAVWDYQPSETIAGYVERSTMTARGEFLFYATAPVVEADETFDAICSNDEEGVGTLGCYLPATSAIHLYDITDERLDGMEDVIASHEMLHAAWARMSPDELAVISPLLEAQAKSMASDAAFTARMEFYARSEPGERLNELHSILGTEVAELDPRLEKHYAELFDDRQALVALHVASNQVFVDLEARAAALVAELDALAAGIESDYAAYTAGYDQLDADVSSFNSRADSGDFTSSAQFNRERAALISRQDDLDALFASISERDTQYTAKVAELDGLNADVDVLNSSINITPRTGDGL